MKPWYLVVAFWWFHVSCYTGGYSQTGTFNCSCKNGEGDIAFLVDESSSIDENSFKKMLGFLNSISDSLTIGKTQTHVALTLFSNGHRDAFRWTEDHGNVTEGIRQIVHKGGATETHEGLSRIRTSLFNPRNAHYKNRKHDVPKVVILLTDGKSSNKTQTIHEANLTRNEGIQIYCIGIGNSTMVDFNELASIASKPNETHVFSVLNFDSLSDIVCEISSALCQAVGGSDLTTTDAASITTAFETKVLEVTPTETGTPSGITSPREHITTEVKSNQSAEARIGTDDKGHFLEDETTLIIFSVSTGFAVLLSCCCCAFLVLLFCYKEKKKTGVGTKPSSDEETRITSNITLNLQAADCGEYTLSGVQRNASVTSTSQQGNKITRQMVPMKSTARGTYVTDDGLEIVDLNDFSSTPPTYSVALQYHVTVHKDNAAPRDSKTKNISKADDKKREELIKRNLYEI